MMFTPNSYLVENGDEYIIGVVNAFQLKTKIASNEFNNSYPKYPDKKKELKKFTNSLKETDNQILVMVKLKK